jgi:hypothetical protein
MATGTDQPGAAPSIGVSASGQLECWDERGRPIACAGSGQDGEFRAGIPWPHPRFVSVEAGEHDRLTGLTWLSDAGYFEWPATWFEALEAVADLSRRDHLGCNDWRLPNRRELWSLISFTDRNPALPAGHLFRNVFLGWYWSSTTAARNPSYAWVIQMTGGRVFFEDKRRDAMIWPCRGASRVIPATGEGLVVDREEPPLSGAHVDGGAREAAGCAWPEPRFETREDRVADRLTGRCWMQTADLCGGEVSWTVALDRVRRLNKGGPTSALWRLPTIRELESLLDARRSDPSLPAGHVFQRVGAGYWSSTTSAFEHDWAMVLHLDRGAIGVGIKRDPRYLVWPVSGL